VLDGPYGTLTLPGIGDLPLTAIGCAAYAAVACLALLPLLSPKPLGEEDIGEEGTNRAVILFLVTAMAVFSLDLLSLLFYVLHANCPYCLVSASISIAMAVIAWTTGCVMPAATDASITDTTSQQLPIQITAGSLGLATAAALVLFFNSGSAMAPDALQAQAATATTTESSSFVFAKASAPPKQQPQNVPPPPITSTSTPQALQIARDLVSLDAKMYGAYWCSHCNDQKQIMGREAMQLVTYVECAKEGKDSRKDLCKARDVPGFPTWDIGGKLYPGEWGLDELEEIVGKAMKKEGR